MRRRSCRNCWATPAVSCFTTKCAVRTTRRTWLRAAASSMRRWVASSSMIRMTTIQEQLINTGRVRWKFRDFPLAVHKYSRFAAHAAQCAGAQGRYFEMQDQLFEHHQWAQTGKDPSNLFRSLGQAAGVDLNAYDACMKAGRYAQRIEYSRQEGDSVRVDGTPTFFANGRKLDFRRLPGSDDFKAIADSIIAHSPRH